MKRSRAKLLAVSASTILAIAAATSQAGSPLPSDLASSQIVIGADQPAAVVQDDPTPVPEPTSLALFGIGISSFITLRRFRKLFY
ncbi:PEP-CTERM sorting domain-containing protein [Paludisphaera borealis]|uniref:Ice-binding protein C-terminal domain-containing protein n=1 Tax=Paludisphaera borealis TaxID=1387353 RepID=A0A1U7CJT0_9BACT|nr:PEP-CTERM sorting domain-containing protein [Paludisphaera borealis]APW59200.1 hypothetical protein BSF38_00615 [Paludisphaera borealis]